MSFVTSVRFLAHRVHRLLCSPGDSGQCCDDYPLTCTAPSVVSLTSLSPDKGISNDTLPSAMDVLGQPGRCMSTPVLPFAIALHHIHTCLHDRFTSRYLYTSTKWRWTSTGATPFRHKIKSPCSLPHLTLLPIRLPFLNWLYSDKVGLWCILVAVWRQTLSESACYMVKSKVVWWYFRWDRLLHQFLKSPSKLMPSALKWETSAIAHTVYMYFSSGFLHISLSSINIRCFVWGRDWIFKHLLDELLQHV